MSCAHTGRSHAAAAGGNVGQDSILRVWNAADGKELAQFGK